MQRLRGFNVVSLHEDLHSKLVDGVLAAVILCLLWLTVSLAVRPIEMVFGLPGLLIYVLGLMAVAMYSLQQAITSTHSEATRAWFGIAGGFLAWSVMVVSVNLGAPLLTTPAGMILPIMVSLILMVLWRTALPLGARFFSLTLMLNWIGLILMNAQQWLARYSSFFTFTYRATGFLSIMGALLTLGWILSQSRHRLQRVSGALALWFLISLALYVFRGGLF